MMVHPSATMSNVMATKPGEVPALLRELLQEKVIRQDATEAGALQGMRAIEGRRRRGGRANIADIKAGAQRARATEPNSTGYLVGKMACGPALSWVAIAEGLGVRLGEKAWAHVRHQTANLVGEAGLRLTTLSSDLLERRSLRKP
jgi:hypothetical protein